MRFVQVSVNSFHNNTPSYQTCIVSACDALNAIWCTLVLAYHALCGSLLRGKSDLAKVHLFVVKPIQ